MSGNSLAMMPWFPRDFIAATRHLALAERGAYRELLDYQWEMGALPTDQARLARLLAVTPEEFAPIWAAIGDKFEVSAAGLRNKRLEEHRNKAIEQRDKKVNGASKTNAKRYAQRPYSEAQCESLSDTLTGSPPTPSPSPSIKDCAATPARGKPTAEGEMAVALRNLGIVVTSMDPMLEGWIRDGFTVEQAAEAVSIARIRKPKGAIPAAYIDPILRQPQRPPNGAPRIARTAWDRLVEANSGD